MPQPLKFSCDKGCLFQSVEKVTLLSLRNEAISLGVSVRTFANLFEIVWLRKETDAELASVLGQKLPRQFPDFLDLYCNTL